MTDAKAQKCERCKGTGGDSYAVAGSMDLCPACNGYGKAVEAADAKVRRYELEWFFRNERTETEGWKTPDRGPEIPGTRATVVLASDYDAALAELTTLRARLAELTPHAKWLRTAGDEIAKAGHYGWGNTCSFAADAIDAALQQGPTKGES